VVLLAEQLLLPAVFAFTLLLLLELQLLFQTMLETLKYYLWLEAAVAAEDVLAEGELVGLCTHLPDL
jgi:hypothetical protein